MTLLRTLSSLALGRALFGASVMGVGALAAIAIIERTGAGKQTRDLGDVADKAQAPAQVKDAPTQHAAPEDTLGILNHAAGIILAAFASQRRVQSAPWLAISATVAAAPAALSAMRELNDQLPRKQRSSSMFHTVDNFSHIAAFAFTCYESSKVVGGLLKGKRRR